MSRARGVARRTFQSLHVRNYRLFFFGQMTSQTGTWMQQVAQIWLVLRITNSPVAAGLTTAFQFTPTLLVGAWGGLVADRFDKRRVLMMNAAISGVLAFILFGLAASGVIQVWMVWTLAASLGLVNAIDNPVRQSFVVEMVGPDDLPNAVGLNGAVMTGSRVVGTAAAGALIAGIGITPCFLINAVSYAAVITGLWIMHPDELHRAGLVQRARGQLREGVRYVWATPELRRPLLMLMVIGMLAYNFQITLALMARFVFNAGGGTFGALSSVMACGSVVGSLVSASQSRPTQRRLMGAALILGTLIVIAASAPNLPLEMVALVPMGALTVFFITTMNSVVQLNSRPDMRGRVMALYSVLLLGSTPIGGPLVGWIGQRFGARFSLGIGGVAAIFTAAVALVAAHRRRPAPVSSLPVGASETVAGEAAAQLAAAQGGA